MWVDCSQCTFLMGGGGGQWNVSWRHQCCTAQSSRSKFHSTVQESTECTWMFIAGLKLLMWGWPVECELTAPVLHWVLVQRVNPSPEIVLKFLHFVDHLAHFLLEVFILLHELFDERFGCRRLGPQILHHLETTINEVIFNIRVEASTTLWVWVADGRDSRSRSSSLARSSADRLSSIRSSLMVSSSRMRCWSLIDSELVPFIASDDPRVFFIDVSSSFSRSRRSHRVLYLSSSFFMSFTCSCSQVLFNLIQFY